MVKETLFIVTCYLALAICLFMSGSNIISAAPIEKRCPTCDCSTNCDDGSRNGNLDGNSNGVKNGYVPYYSTQGEQSNTGYVSSSGSTSSGNSNNQYGSSSGSTSSGDSNNQYGSSSGSTSSGNSNNQYGSSSGSTSSSNSNNQYGSSSGSSSSSNSNNQYGSSSGSSSSSNSNNQYGSSTGSSSGSGVVVSKDTDTDDNSISDNGKIKTDKDGLHYSVIKQSEYASYSFTSKESFYQSLALANCKNSIDYLLVQFMDGTSGTCGCH
ncbi:13552_t:CDS:2 [Ambispora leptoticha]|uniref:13552_t:CDS:1 n=1 Tax=Ambispora leptoticha TaxID=144679 RepID=A0A9N8WDV5_9GLOM|nr:13552_t:CDS:2 [Ambispora leptoticha]